MKRSSILLGAVMLALVAASAASAQQQFIPPGGSQYNPPLPPPPAVPKIEVPVIPKMDAPPAPPRVQGLQRGSFGDRIGKCLDDAAAAGLGPTERAAYSRSCANQ
ncbi:hypothetical protein KMZ93_11875 [Bradyrhizobium sediminis]|uniref:Uncharacterized protein n=2 Tax=Bradyrhizobium sediminis TaxID=2840469 RepID=A0A975RZR9_9BRAD|nr:hypothetical protein KMZ93_11875 [Bradyrhizobium sediminis]